MVDMDSDTNNELQEIEKTDLIKYLQLNNRISDTVNEDVIDFVLLKLNEIRYEVGLKIKKRQNKPIKKDGS
ncbi:MAG: hypothetical protein ACTSP3_14355 [Candidatus Heimdallarchaeaceae archaeon]